MNESSIFLLKKTFSLWLRQLTRSSATTKRLPLSTQIPPVDSQSYHWCDLYFPFRAWQREVSALCVVSWNHDSANQINHPLDYVCIHKNHAFFRLRRNRRIKWLGNKGWNAGEKSFPQKLSEISVQLRTPPIRLFWAEMSWITPCNKEAYGIHWTVALLKRSKSSI